MKGSQASGKKARQKAWQRGSAAEGLAAFALRLKGYRIIAARYRCPSGEIDLVAQRGAALVFVEVKARATLALGLEAISPRQQARIRAAAQTFMAAHPGSHILHSRFDAIIVCPAQNRLAAALHLPRITHRPNAWQ